MGTEYFATESAVMFSSVEMKLLSTTLALICLLIRFPFLSWAKSRLKFFPEFLFHHRKCNQE